MSNDFTPTFKARYMTSAGSVVELVIPLNADDIDALIEQSVHIDARALELGLNVANPMASSAVSAAKASGITPQREGNPVFHCVSMDILPQADGRTKVALFGNSFKQPRDDFSTVNITFKPSELVEKFADYYTFKEATFQKAQSLDVDFYVEWYNSNKLNKAGNPYKNFAGIHAKDGAKPPSAGQAPAPPAEVVAEQDEIPF